MKTQPSIGVSENDYSNWLALQTGILEQARSFQGFHPSTPRPSHLRVGGLISDKLSAITLASPLGQAGVLLLLTSPAWGVLLYKAFKRR